MFPCRFCQVAQSSGFLSGSQQWLALALQALGGSSPPLVPSLDAAAQALVGP